MNRLAWNTLISEGLRAKYKIALFVAPIALMLAGPLFTFAVFLVLVKLFVSRFFDLIEHPAGVGLLLAIIPAAMLFSMYLGYVVGWLLNAAFARSVLGWSPQTVRGVFLHSQIPPHWFKEGWKGVDYAVEQAMASWEAQRWTGFWRFVMKRGVVVIGLEMIMVIFIIPMVLEGQRFSQNDLLIGLGVAIAVGGLLGALQWYLWENNYRKLKQQARSRLIGARSE